MSYIYLWIVFFLFINDKKQPEARETTRSCLTMQDLTPFQSTILSLHNAARSKHEDTPPLCWSQNIADDALTHAEALTDPEQNPDGIETKSHYHVQDETDNMINLGQTQLIKRYGENLYRAKILFSGVTEQEMARSAVQSWYNEEPLYNYKFELGAYSGAAKRASASAHLYSTRKFTQMIWRSTTRIGCAFSTRPSHYYFVVCMYTPEGNKGDKSTFHSNVRKKITCDPPVIYKGKHTTTGPFLLDQTVTLRCNPGYHLVGSRVGTCLRNKTFQFDVEPRCTGCEVQAIANGTASREVGSVVPDDETVTYSCNEGYSLDDAARVLQCDGNDFVHDVPKCRKEGYCLRPDIENGIAYARSIDDDFGFRGKGQGWDHNIPDGHNISIICGEGYELVGNSTSVCRGEKFTGGVGSCKLSDPQKISSATPLSLPTHWLLFTLSILPLVPTLVS